MVFETTLTVMALILGIAFLAYCSHKAVEYSVKLASTLGVSPLMVGLVVVSLGTDLPEISNSIVSSILGHGDINVGDSFGSVLAQISLVLGIFPFLGGRFRVRRDEVVVIGACEVLALIASVSMVEKGYISRLNGVFMVTSWPILMLIAKNAIFREARVPRTDPGVLRDLAMAILSYLGVAVGSYVVINSVITLSALLHIHEYILSFFMLAIGTSLPELAVDLTAIRKKQYEIAVGDAMGSCIVDAGFSIGVGALLSPITVSARLAETTGAYAILVSVVVIATLALREKLDRKAGALFIALYLVSYALLAMG
jgi:cation:H+ antiporter